MNIELAPEEYRKPLTYDEAIMYCFSLVVDGAAGWRMPTIDELEWQLENDTIDRPRVHMGVIPLYWTSTTLKHKPVAVTKLFGKVIVHSEYHTEVLWSVPVRDL